MADYSSNLELSPATLRTLSTAYEGYARALEKDEQKQGAHQNMIASCYAIAALYRAVFDQQSATGAFARAARAYQNINNSYWKILAICGLDQHILSEGGAYTPGNDPNELYHELMRQFFLFSIRRQNSLDKLLAYIDSMPILAAIPVGKPPIPLEVYLSIIRTVVPTENSYGSTANARLSLNFQALLQRNESQFRFLQVYNSQWRNQAIHIPFEPEWLAISLCLYIQPALSPILQEFSRNATNENRIFFTLDIAEKMVQSTRFNE